jgi:hypothetical protein
VVECSGGALVLFDLRTALVDVNASNLNSDGTEGKVKKG